LKLTISIRLCIALILTGLSLVGVGLLLAQDATATQTPAQAATLPPPLPTPIPIEELTCNLEYLLNLQSDLALALTNFGENVQDDPAQELAALFRVGEVYQQLALECGYIPPDAAARVVGTDIARILTTLETISGDPLNGQVLYNGEYGCAGCHEGANRVAPATEGTFTRVEDTRLTDPALAGYSAEQYLIESIVQPGHYVAPGHQNIMPNNFGERLTAQELADLLLFLESQDQLLSVLNPTRTEFAGELTTDVQVGQQPFAGRAGDVLIVTLDSQAFDPILRVLSPDGAELALNDDFGGTTNARVGPLPLPDDGVYILQIDSYDRQATGGYTLEVATYTGCGPVPVGIVRTTTQSVNLRANPNTDSDVAGSVTNDECFSIVGRASSNDWLLAQTPAGSVGWIVANFVEVAGDVNAVPILSN